MKENTQWYTEATEQGSCRSGVCSVEPEVFLFKIHSFSRKGSTGCECSYKSKYFQQLFLPGAQQAMLCVCFHGVCKAIDRCFPGLSLLTGDGSVPTSPHGSHCPVALLVQASLDAPHPTSGKASCLSYIGRLMLQADCRVRYA